MPESFFDDDETEGLDSGEDEPVAPPPPGQHRQHWSSAPSKVVDDILTPAEPEEAPAQDNLETEVERRLEVARYYNMLLHHDTFQDDPGPAAKTVQKEVREFVRKRLSLLMGVAPEEKPQVQKAYDIFTDQEVSVLKQVALAVIAKAEGRAAPKPAEPVFKPVEAQKPEPQRPVPAPAPKPVVQKPPPPAPKPVPTQAQKPQSQPQGHQAPAVAAGRLPPEWLARVLIDHRNDPTLVLKNGKVYRHAKDPDGTPLYIYEGATKKKVPYLVDVTIPARPMNVTPLPMPLATTDVNTPYNQIMQAQEAGVLSFAEKKAGAMGILGHMAQAIVHSNLTKDVQTEEQFDVNDHA